ncbi:MAG: YkgJ family cysteine cluster protein [Bacteroidales bacterium]
MDDQENPHAMEELEKSFYNDGYLLAEKLVKSEDLPGSLQNAVKQFYSVLDSFLEIFLKEADSQGTPAHCKKGCAWCCHQPVFAQTHEFLYLKNWMFKNLGTKQVDKVFKRAGKKHKTTKSFTQEQRLLHKEPCPLLVNNTCSVYKVRPMACRIYLSRNLASCISEFSNPGDKSSYPMLFDLPLRAGRSMNNGFVNRLKEMGIDVEEMVIEQGILAAHGN